MIPTIPIPTYPQPKKEVVPVKVTAVERSIAKPDAFAKPATIGKPANSKVRVRLTNEKPKGRRRRRNDKRDVQFY
jgi:hypothetical protein